MSERVYNFSAGPAVLPLQVLERVRDELICLPGVGSSILEISHRSKEFIEILESAKTNIQRLLGVPDNYRIMFLQGGSRLQFSMIPMNLLRGADAPASYLLTGTWGKKAYEEARKEGIVQVAWDGGPAYNRLPIDEEYTCDPQSAYLYFTSNETIQGIQFADPPRSGSVPLICDASSDFLSRPLNVADYGLIYACAQKNAGPAGVTVVIMREDLFERVPDRLAGYLNYQNHTDNNSLYNTPPTFAIYVVNLIAQWLRLDMGGLEGIERLNRKKAELLYQAIDESGGFYEGHAHPEARSIMNVTFRLPSPELESQFVSEARQASLANLKGHRSVGGIRASIYNAMPLAGAEALAAFMVEFQRKNG